LHGKIAAATAIHSRHIWWAIAAVVHCHVDDVAATLEKVMAMGAKEYERLTKRVMKQDSPPLQ